MKVIVALSFIFLAFFVQGQQLTHYSQQPFNQVLMNPAFAGNNPCAELKSVHRAQWVGIGDAPRTTGVAVTGRLGKKTREQTEVFHGFAVRFENDRIGPFEHNRVHAAYAIHLPFKNDHFLSFGTYVGLDNFVFSNDNLNPLQSDPAVQVSRASFLTPDFIFGAKYNTQKLFFALALQNFVPLRYPIGLDAKKVFHANFSTGAKFALGKSDWELLPLVNIRFAARTPIAIDAYAIADYNNKLQFGLGYRNQESVIFLARFRVLPRLTVGYSFDLITNQLKRNMAGTHEISIAISACKERKKGVAICPVFE
jgi:type IX secretion system PorP/SprF family membrane protein